LSLIFYNIFLLLYKGGIHFASYFNEKANKWTRGRKQIFQKLANEIPPGSDVIWIHCASLGEFEQGRPVIERLKAQGTGHKILLTFFSPSGYEVRKNYQEADWVFYLPMDGPGNAKRFMGIVKPRLVIFVKYELWHYYLKNLKAAGIPTLLISALFRKDKPFFKWYGALHRKMLLSFDHIFVQNEESKELLDKIGLATNCTVSGDTRFDRVVEIAEINKELPFLKQFASDRTIIAGSTWKEDEGLLQKLFSELKEESLKLIIAPHEITDKHIKELKKLFPGSILYSEFEKNNQLRDADPVLIVDNIGILAYLYKYAYLTYVGGGFRTGLHNVLEAAVYDKIVLYGPLYKEHNEAVGLAKSAGGIPVENKEELITWVKKLFTDSDDHLARSRAAGEFVRTNTGATQKIMKYIQEKRLLTS
jgi:3-deoxy-D-manno-octulosonic-acid transferase